MHLSKYFTYRNKFYAESLNCIPASIYSNTVLVERHRPYLCIEVIGAPSLAANTLAYKDDNQKLGLEHNQLSYTKTFVINELKRTISYYLKIDT